MFGEGGVRWSGRFFQGPFRAPDQVGNNLRGFIGRPSPSGRGDRADVEIVVGGVRVDRSRLGPAIQLQFGEVPLLQVMDVQREVLQIFLRGVVDWNDEVGGLLQ